MELEGEGEAVGVTEALVLGVGVNELEGVTEEVALVEGVTEGVTEELGVTEGVAVELGVTEGLRLGVLEGVGVTEIDGVLDGLGVTEGDTEGLELTEDVTEGVVLMEGVTEGLTLIEGVTEGLAATSKQNWEDKSTVVLKVDCTYESPVSQFETILTLELEPEESRTQRNVYAVPAVTATAVPLMLTIMDEEEKGLEKIADEVVTLSPGIK
mmetsp:Transcript_10311/g.14144  ORF Transcript_10311/g.14144 Transcript_10311/m.14144 type:complete len:211 (+) Transcript_10311:1149-1781(+)